MAGASTTREGAAPSGEDEEALHRSATLLQSAYRGRIGKKHGDGNIGKKCGSKRTGKKHAVESGNTGKKYAKGEEGGNGLTCADVAAMSGGKDLATLLKD